MKGLVGLTCSGYDSAWSSLLWARDDFGVSPSPMWITQLSHWQTAVEAQDDIDQGGPVTNFSSFNTRMICCKFVGGVLGRRSDLIQIMRSVSLSELTSSHSHFSTD